MIATRRGAVALVLLAATACAAAPERGYYLPEGMDPGPVIQSRLVQFERAGFDVRCQGVYEDVVDELTTVTVHVQADITRPISEQLVVARDGWRVVCDGPDGRRLRLPVSELWQGRQRVMGDLTVPGFRRRAFDLFFDTTALVGRAPPAWIEVRWRGGPGDEDLVGSARFVRIPSDSPALPGAEPVGDREFGFRNGYYLPGTIALGERELQASDEERTHYLFHAPPHFSLWPW